MKHTLILSLAASSLILSSCTAVSIATGVGVAAGSAAVQEGGVSRALSDARIQTEINDLWFRHNVAMFTKLDLTVNQGRVLITGVVQDPQHRVEAVRMAWQPEGVLQVINEIKVADSEGLIGYARDAWISTRLRSSLILDGDVESINYSIDTVQGTVYLMGFAQNQHELNHVIEVTRTIENVRQVVSYVKLVGAPDVVTPQRPESVSYDATGQASVGQASQQPAQANGDPIEWSQESVYD
ncbi:MAG: BON domain-containing protein [Alphaproteobacteria bacterium]